MAFNVVREIIGPKLTLRSYLAFRLIVPVVVYAWLALNLAMVRAWLGPTKGDSNAKNENLTVPRLL
jgi:hypothetical protein